MVKILRFVFLVFGLGPLCQLGFSLSLDSEVRLAIFSRGQFFWPSLSATVPTKDDSIKIGVLPIQIQKYSESIPCDSCHRLSANGMEFYFENYLKDKLADRFKSVKVELIAPHFNLVENRKIDLLKYLTRLNFPWPVWFGTEGDSLERPPVIFRERDRWLSSGVKKQIDSLGGLLNQEYLLIPTQIQIHVLPVMSNGHTGILEWKFSLVFWNVGEGRPEWALKYSGKSSLGDLDQSLDSHLDKALGAAWDGVPKQLEQIWKAEPR